MTFFDQAPQNTNLADICKSKQYICNSLEIPTTEEILCLKKVLDITDEDFLLSYLDYEIFVAELEEVATLMKIDKAEILSRAIALQETVEEAKNNNRSLVIIDDLGNITPIKI